MSARFDPAPNTNYGVCLTCKKEFATQQDARVHMDETLDQAKLEGKSKGHRTTAINPTREQRIQSAVNQEIDDRYQGIYISFEDFQRWIDDEQCTLEEIDKAVRYSDADYNIWEEWKDNQNDS